MTIFRYSAQAGTYDRGVLFPFIMAGLLGLWALIAVAIACHPKLAAVDAAGTGAAAYVSCQPANALASRAPGQLLRCTIDPVAAAAPGRDI
ncbi:MAG: hypothetical protein HQ502_18580 [Alphaproteobacteria bacterium]|nr:hypothetical protein [Alphaproteobacteria bacterium]